MGMNTAIKNGQILENAYGVLGIELMAAAQALDFRDFTSAGASRRPAGSSGVTSRTSTRIGRSTPTTPTMKALVRSGEILDEVEAVVGRLD